MYEISEEERARISKRDRQRRWRQNKIRRPEQRFGPPFTVSLNALETALLDHLAIEDYAQRPCGRDGYRDETPPSRSRAIRLLIQRYIDVMGVNVELLGPLIERRDLMGGFWTHEACWRQASHDNRAEQDSSGNYRIKQPRPPWED